MQLSDTRKVDAAFQTLTELVRQYALEGRTARGAGLKVELQRRIAFDEREIGFWAFGRFLAEAERRGLVLLSRIPGGDIEVTQRDSSMTSTASRPLGSYPKYQPRRVLRPDLWSCFVDWRQGWRRFYDRKNDRAVMFPIEASPLDDVEQSRVRSSQKLDPSSFIEIEPIAVSIQMEWMRQFCEGSTDAAVRAVLERSLAQQRPFSEFTRTIRLTRLGAAWHAFRVRNVATEIQKWADNNHLNLSLFNESALPSDANRSPIETSPSATDEEDIRARIRAAIDRMPLGELLRLAIPLEYIFPRRK
jgi:hypothetical protein